MRFLIALLVGGICGFMVSWDVGHKDPNALLAIAILLVWLRVIERKKMEI